jgi:hypothetical protein
MKASLQSTLKQSTKESLVLGYYCHKRDTIFVCKAGKIIERLAGWQMPYFINKYVEADAA